MTKPIDTWMPFYIGDYLADTIGLTRAEHGSYILAIMAYWRRGGPLPEAEALCIMGAEADSLRRFFQPASGFWTHKRIEIELGRAAKNQNQKSIAGKASAAKRWGWRDGSGTGTESNGRYNYVTEPLQRLDAPSPSPSPRKKVKEKASQEGCQKESAAPSALDIEFDNFFDHVYPRRVGRLTARKAWVKAIAGGVLAKTMLEAAARFRDDPNREAEFTPHPATWLNQGRWEDDPLPVKSNGKGNQHDKQSGWDKLFAADKAKRVRANAGELAEGMAPAEDVERGKPEPVPPGDPAPVAGDAERSIPAMPPNESVPPSPGRAVGGSEG